jgi:hypothetical protein
MYLLQYRKNYYSKMICSRIVGTPSRGTVPFVLDSTPETTKKAVIAADENS